MEHHLRRLVPGEAEDEAGVDAALVMLYRELSLSLVRLAESLRVVQKSTFTSENFRNNFFPL